MAVGLNKLDGLQLGFRQKLENVITDMEAKGWSIRVIWGKRTQQENMALVKKGVASKTSKHLDGKAADIVDRQVGYSDDKNHPYYKDLEHFSKKHGLIWGGDFSSRWDPCHVELP